MSEKNGPGSTKKTPHIVILGDKGAGKTTLLASLCHDINKQSEFQLRYDLNDKEGIDYLKKIWQETLVKGKFAPQHFELRNEEVALSIVSVKEKVEHNFTFLELPKEIISVFPYKNAADENYNKFRGYVEKADLVIMVVEVGEAHGQDLSVSIFFQALQEHGIMPPVILVLSKWDRLEAEIADAEKLARDRMPSTYKWLNYGPFPGKAIFKFSVGQVEEHSEYDELGRLEDSYDIIKKFDFADSGEIFNWILDYFRPQKMPALGQILKEKLAQLSLQPENIELLKEIKDLYLQMGEEKEAKEVDRKLERLIEKREYKYNLGKQIILQQVELHDLDFFNDFSWRFQPGVNVLLGKNGYGKSYLLRFLAALLQENDDITSEFFENSKTEPFARLVLEREHKRETIDRNRLVFAESIGRVPVLAIPDLRVVDKSKATVTVSEYEKEADLSRQWSHHFLMQKPVEGLIQDFLYQLCITYLDKGKTFDLPIFQLIQEVVEKLSGHRFVFHKIEPVGQAWFKIQVITEGNPNPIPIQKASQGTLSVLSLFGLIYSYLKSVFPTVKEKDLPGQPAIVFIDEIDAHLHPSWQQKIIGLLREHFPNVQFIVTAHSPLVVAGCKEGEVALLCKAESGFVVKLFEQDFIGYVAGELYETVFEIEEKDDSYLYYNAMYPFRGEIEAEIKILEKEKARASKTFSKEKEKKLNQLYDDLYYAKRANEKFEKRQENSRILLENRKLKSKIKKLENPNRAVK